MLDFLLRRVHIVPPSFAAQQASKIFTELWYDLLWLNPFRINSLNFPCLPLRCCLKLTHLFAYLTSEYLVLFLSNNTLQSVPYINNNVVQLFNLFFYIFTFDLKINYSTTASSLCFRDAPTVV